MLHHIELYVSDLAKSRYFYDFLLSRLGYELYQDWPDGFSMALYRPQLQAMKGDLEPLMPFERSEKGNPLRQAEHYIVFVQTPTAFLEAGYHRCRTGLNHLAFHGGSRESVDQLRKDLLDRGAKLLYDDRYPYAGGPEHYALYFEDPDGVKVEVVGTY
ncbi:MAG: VOC family protein [Aerococcaceae bacterium]|nr:VOC family protein [Aerococcaceae bacterium]